MIGCLRQPEALVEMLGAEPTDRLVFVVVGSHCVGTVEIVVSRGDGVWKQLSEVCVVKLEWFDSHTFLQVRKMAHSYQAC